MADSRKPVVAIIGSEGWLGRHLCRVLQDRYRVRRVDLFCPNEPGTLRADVRNQEDMERAVEGAEVVVHLAAFHGGYRPLPTDETRFDVNVVGTFRAFQACLKKEVRKVVWASSIAALSRKGFYSITKVMGEDLCDYYHLTHGMQIAMLRYGSFTPFDFVSCGERLLGMGIDVRDCASAAERAVDLLAEGAAMCERFILVASAFMPGEDRRRIVDDGDAYLATIDPCYPALVSKYGIKMPDGFREFDIETTRSILGLEPAYTFQRFLSDLKRMDRSGAVTAESPRWRFEEGTRPPEGVVWPPGLGL